MGLLQFDLARLIGICELKIIDKKKYHAITTMERDRSGKPAAKIIEMRCRAALSEYKVQVKKTQGGWETTSKFPFGKLS